MSFIKSEPCDHCDNRLALLEQHIQLTLNHISILLTRQATLEKEVEKLMANQADLDAKELALAGVVKGVTDGLGALKTNLETSVADLQAQLDAAKNGQPLDFTSLDASIAGLQANVASISGLSDEAKAADPGPVVPPPPVNG